MSIFTLNLLNINMKKLTLLTVVISLTFFSCKKDTKSTEDEVSISQSGLNDLNSSETYFPIEPGNTWDYQIINNGTISESTLTVLDNEEVINNQTYRVLESKDKTTQEALNTYLRLENSLLYAMIETTTNGFDLSLNESVILKPYLILGDEWEYVSTSESETSVTTTTNNTVVKEFFDTYTNNGITYNDVALLETISITNTEFSSQYLAILQSSGIDPSTIAFPSVTITSYYYYGKSIGLIFSETLSSNQQITQTLLSHNLN